jgi:hypothetical protein
VAKLNDVHRTGGTGVAAGTPATWVLEEDFHAVLSDDGERPLLDPPAGCRGSDHRATEPGVWLRQTFAVFVAITFTASQAHALRAAEIVVRDAPTGSKVYVDGRYLGDTPLYLPVPCGEVADRKYRIESPTCGVQEGILNARVRGGVIVAYIFTLGILAIFLCPRYFEPVRVVFTGGRCAGTNLGGGVLPPATRLNVIEPQPSGDLAERLKVLKDLHDRGVLSDEQYEQERNNALNGL